MYRPYDYMLVDNEEWLGGAGIEAIWTVFSHAYSIVLALRDRVL